MESCEAFGGKETSMNISFSSFCLEGAQRPIAIVNEKSPPSSFVGGGSSAAIWVATRGFNSSRSKKNCDCSSFGEDLLRRARYEASRSESSLRPAPLDALAREQGSPPASRFIAGRVDSQKLHIRTFEGSTAPHCKHIFVTGAFCAADACTPARSDPFVG